MTTSDDWMWKRQAPTTGMRIPRDMTIQAMGGPLDGQPIACREGQSEHRSGDDVYWIGLVGDNRDELRLVWQNAAWLALTFPHA